MLAGEVRHVLKDPDNRHVRPAGHVGHADSHLLGSLLGSGDNDHLSLGEQSGECHLDVAGSGWHVDDQIVQLSPGDLVQKLFQGLGKHETPPHESRLFALDDEPCRNHLQTVRFGGLDEAGCAVGLHPLGGAEHSGDRKTPDVGVEDSDPEPEMGDRQCQVDARR